MILRGVTQDGLDGQWFPEVARCFSWAVGSLTRSGLGMLLTTRLWLLWVGLPQHNSVLHLRGGGGDCVHGDGGHEPVLHFLKAHWFNSNVNLPRAGCLFVVVRSDFQWQFLSLMMGWKARRKMKGRGRISICVANDLLTRDLMHTHRCLWWRMVTGNPGLGGNYKCFVTLCPSVLWAERRCNLLFSLLPLLLCSLREWFITIFLSVQKPCLTSHPVFCIRRGGKLLGCGYAEINQNILTNILTGSWLLGSLEPYLIPGGCLSGQMWSSALLIHA